MVAVVPKRATTTDQAIHEARDPNSQSSHPTLELRRPVRFYQQVQMILLDAELQNAEAIRRARAQRVLDWNQEAFVPEGGDVSASPQGNVGRTARIMRSAPKMR